MGKNWRTTIAGAISLLVWLVAKFGIEVSPDVSDGILAVALFVITIFVKDAAVTGIGNKATDDVTKDATRPPDVNMYNA